MSTPLIFTAILHLLLLILLLSPTTAASPITEPERKDNVAFKPPTRLGKHGFGRGQVNSCLPKGLRYNSAPSRYINYHPTGSSLCSSAKHTVKP
ncbi:hypothetical protein NMG60_11018658 [Bertholletia excelsa]